jgi:prolipoprotein diacylglyceryltransferase
MVLPTDPHWHLAFDLLAWLTAALVARWVVPRFLPQSAAITARAMGMGYLLALTSGGLAGAFLFGSLNLSWNGGLHLGHSVAGALAGAIVAVELFKLTKGIRVSTGAIWVAPLAAGIAVGRVGCLFAGLSDQTYGSPTTLPWAIDLGDGVPRHPVQLYESAAMLLFLGIYLVALRRQAAWAVSRGFYVFVGFYAVQRFAWEFPKPYPAVWLGLTIFQLLSLGLLAYALVYHERARRSGLAQGQSLALLRADHQPL